jgi:hypothetical protein
MHTHAVVWWSLQWQQLPGIHGVCMMYPRLGLPPALLCSITSSKYACSTLPVPTLTLCAVVTCWLLIDACPCLHQVACQLLAASLSTWVLPSSVSPCQRGWTGAQASHTSHACPTSPRRLRWGPSMLAFSRCSNLCMPPVRLPHCQL